jgi:predicted PurR-regulated permease PerM
MDQHAHALRRAHEIGPGRHPATSVRSATHDPRRTAAIVVCLGLIVVAALTISPFVVAIVFAAWAAHLASPLFRRLEKVLRGSSRAAGVVTAGLVLLAAGPIGLLMLAVIPAVRSLVEQLRAASGGKGMLAALVSNGGGVPTGKTDLVALAKDYGAGASKVAALAASASVEAFVGAFVFFVMVYTFLLEGPRWWSWAKEHAPVDDAILARLGRAFQQAGRGLLVGSGLTALAQGALATVIYLAFGVPRALLLGFLTALAALVPMTGTMIVWIPLAAGLALTGHPGKAAGLAAVCAVVVGSVDNLLRPWLSRRFDAGLPGALLLLAMLGGVVVFGGWGLFLGPLAVRLAAEMLAITRERRLFRV